MQAVPRGVKYDFEMLSLKLRPQNLKYESPKYSQMAASAGSALDIGLKVQVSEKNWTSFDRSSSSVQVSYLERGEGYC